jgi:adenylate cyclase class 1
MRTVPSRHTRSSTPDRLEPRLDSGIDRRVHTQVRDRFLGVNHARLDRALDSLSPRHRNFLHMLPVLLHVNHPGLPGYVSPQTPAGFRHYSPGPEALRAMAPLSRAWRYDGNKPTRPRLLSLFLMGSTGTVGQSGGSDLDLWVCHDEDIDTRDLDELRLKLSALETWAESMQLEVHFFPMTTRYFREERSDGITSEDCGSSQQVMLLDEFYRTSLLLAGCAPLWWMVPAYEEHRYEEYATTLTSQRFVNGSEFIDFGGIPEFPAGEFIGSGLWQLYKGISSPYKSVLKILVTEVYAASHPETECLSHQYKRMVYEGQTDPDELDPYMMMYRRIEEYLQDCGEPQRLSLIRHCFYWKVEEPLSKASESRQKSWRHQLMKRLTTEWEWDDAYLQQMDNRARWKVTRVRHEYQELVNELNHSYRFLSRFAKDNDIRPSIGREDVEVLARKLHAAFERKAGKIDIFNRVDSHDIAEEILSLHLIIDPMTEGIDDHWALHRGHVNIRDAEPVEPVKRTRSLMEMLAWCHLNGLVDTATRFSIDAQASDLTDAELSRLLSRVRSAFPEGACKPPDEAFRRAAHVERMLVFINAGVDPLRDLTRRGLHYLSNKTNVLSYSAMNHNLVLCVDEIRINSWGEVTCQQHTGNDALVQSLRRHVQDILDGCAPEAVDVWCECTPRAPAIAARVATLFADVEEHFRQDLPPGEDRQYVLELEQIRYAISTNSGRAMAQQARNDAELCRILSLPRPVYSHTRLDRDALEHLALREIIQAGVKGYIQVFFIRRTGHADFYVHDETGRMMVTRRKLDPDNNMLIPWLRFFHALHLRRQASGDRVDPRLAGAHYYEVTQRGRQFRLEKRLAGSLPPTARYFDVHAMAERDAAGAIHYSLFCGDEEFSWSEYGDTLYSTVATHLLGARMQGERYPPYITDIDLTALSHHRDYPMSTVDYLLHKSRLEDRLGQAMAALP